MSKAEEQVVFSYNTDEKSKAAFDFALPVILLISNFCFLFLLLFRELS